MYNVELKKKKGKIDFFNQRLDYRMQYGVILKWFQLREY